MAQLEGAVAPTPTVAPLGAARLLRRATDMAGGFIAWAEAGLPILAGTR
jgi:hypothetical protein